MTQYTFSLTLGTGKDKASVSVILIETSTLYDLALILLDAIGFELDHAFGFHSGLKRPHMKNQAKEYTLFADNGEPMVDHDTGVENTKINTVFSLNEKMLFHFDYGDDWMFIVKCTAIEEVVGVCSPKPQILEIKGTFPEQYPDNDEDEGYQDDPENTKERFAYNPKTGERIKIPSTPHKITESSQTEEDEEEDYETMAKRISLYNYPLIRGFADYLIDTNLSQKTVDKHCNNVDFYANEFLLNYETSTVDEGSDSIGSFLGSWFIRKTAWASENTIKENLTSLKKFYKWLHETDRLPKEDYQYWNKASADRWPMCLLR